MSVNALLINKKLALPFSIFVCHTHTSFDIYILLPTQCALSTDAIYKVILT